MRQGVLLSEKLDQSARVNNVLRGAKSENALPKLITRMASTQAYYTIRFLADRDRVLNAYRAYAYFRWVDDWLDRNPWNRWERTAFVERQQAVIDCGYQGESLHDVCDEEQMMGQLIDLDRTQDSGLRLYIQHMMAVMAFDAERRGQLISQHQLTDYSQHLAIAVTEALHYFIGHNDPSPHTEVRYLAATAAHITHMLRDAAEDAATGYFNIPREWVERYGIDPCAVDGDLYLHWVKTRVRLARAYFEAGHKYLDQVTSLRCRIAGYAYMARFQSVLDAIERDGYRLRSDYSECKSLRAGLKMCWAVFLNAFRFAPYSQGTR